VARKVLQEVRGRLVDQDLQAKPEEKEQVASRVKVVCQDLRDPEETRAQKLVVQTKTIPNI